jgi:tRNA(His) 5'-end guanylyltransferase
MSQTLLQRHLIAQELSIPQILRVYGKKFKQIKRRFSDERNGRCAMGVILSYYGWDGKLNSLFDASASSRATRQALKNVGINRSCIMDQNDSGYTFDEIADYLERVVNNRI